MCVGVKGCRNKIGMKLCYNGWDKLIMCGEIELLVSWCNDEIISEWLLILKVFQKYRNIEECRSILKNCKNRISNIT